MKIDYKWTDGSNEDFHKFYLKTEEFYSSIVGGLKNRAAFVPYNISESITDVLIASVSEVAVGCAGLKAYSDSDVDQRQPYIYSHDGCIGEKGIRARIQTGNPADKTADGRSCSFIHKTRLCADRKLSAL